MSVETTGDRELALRFETFPARAHAKLVDRITSLTDGLRSRVEAATPFKTGKLRTEITSAVYADKPDRVAGYVEVYAPGGGADEYAKAATLEYGTDKQRRLRDSGGIFRRLGAGQKRIESRLTKAVHIEAFRYLRGPFAQMSDELYSELNAALAEAAAE